MPYSIPTPDVHNLEVYCVNLLREGDMIHTLAESEILAKKILKVATESVEQHGFSRKFENYSLVQKKASIIAKAFKQNFHPEEHSLIENLNNFKGYIKKTYGNSIPL